MVLGTNPMFPPTALKKATGSICVHVGTVHLYVHTVQVYQSTFHVSFASVWRTHRHMHKDKS